MQPVNRRAKANKANVLQLIEQQLDDRNEYEVLYNNTGIIVIVIPADIGYENFDPPETE